jgi:hypothetical protein
MPRRTLSRFGYVAFSGLAAKRPRFPADGCAWESREGSPGVMPLHLRLVTSPFRLPSPLNPASATAWSVSFSRGAIGK